MHKLAFLLCLISSLMFNACDNRPGVDIPFRAYITIPAGLNTGISYHFPIDDMPGVNFDNLVDAQPSSISITTVYGENNLDFIWQAFLLAMKNGSPREMAYQTDLPLNGYGTEHLYPSILNMAEHITQTNFDMELKLVFRSIPVTETQIRIDFSVRGILEG